MSPLLNLGGKRKRSLSQVLSRFLSRTREGKEIIRAFGRDRESASTALVAYLDQHLKDQPEFQRQILEALDKEEGGRFSTLVADGGHVDQIINAGVVEQLEIRYVFFEDTRQVVAFFGILVLIGTVLAYAYWWSIQPRRMSGDFNIAVAEFSQQGDPEPQVSQIVSQQVFRFLDDQAKLITFEDVQVAHKNIGIITSAEEAKDLADRINAQVIIYGDVTALAGEARLTPQFYIAEAFRADVGELNGQQKLAAPISFPIPALLDPTSVPLTLIQERSVIMTGFTKALVYLALQNLPLAQESVNEAIQHSEAQGRFDGQEVLYLFASEIARLQGQHTLAEAYARQALELNPQYGRGYIAMANLYYDQGNLFQAVEGYRQAKDLPDQPFGAYIVEKASLGIGNSCWVQLQYIQNNAEPEDMAVDELEKCMLQNYQQVTASFERQAKPEASLQEMASWAYYGLGALYQLQDRPAEARDMYDRALALTIDPDLTKRANEHMREVNE